MNRIRGALLPTALFVAVSIPAEGQQVVQARMAPVGMASAIARTGRDTSESRESSRASLARARVRAAKKGAVIGAVAGAAVAAMSNAQTAGRPSYSGVSGPVDPFRIFLILVPVGAAVGALAGATLFANPY